MCSKYSRHTLTYLPIAVVSSLALAEILSQGILAFCVFVTFVRALFTLINILNKRRRDLHFFLQYLEYHRFTMLFYVTSSSNVAFITFLQHSDIRQFLYNWACTYLVHWWKCCFVHQICWHIIWLLHTGKHSKHLTAKKIWIIGRVTFLDLPFWHFVRNSCH